MVGCPDIDTIDSPVEAKPDYLKPMGPDFGINRVKIAQHIFRLSA
jgi:hypothetical protein